MKSAAEDYRRMDKTKRAFTRAVKCQSWEEAARSFPMYAQECKLREFTQLKFDGTSLPASFIGYCQAAIDGANVQTTSTAVMYGSFRYVIYVFITTQAS